MRRPVTRTPVAVTLTAQSGGRDEERSTRVDRRNTAFANHPARVGVSAPGGTVSCPIATQARGQPTLPDIILARLRASSRTHRARHQVSPDRATERRQSRPSGPTDGCASRFSLEHQPAGGRWDGLGTGPHAQLPWASSGLVTVRTWDDRRGTRLAVVSPKQRSSTACSLTIRPRPSQF
jgi:hypothetical protein